MARQRIPTTEHQVPKNSADLANLALANAFPVEAQHSLEACRRGRSRISFLSTQAGAELSLWRVWQTNITRRQDKAYADCGSVIWGCRSIAAPISRDLCSQMAAQLDAADAGRTVTDLQPARKRAWPCPWELLSGDLTGHLECIAGSTSSAVVETAAGRSSRPMTWEAALSSSLPNTQHTPQPQTARKETNDAPGSPQLAWPEPKAMDQASEAERSSLPLEPPDHLYACIAATQSLPPDWWVPHLPGAT